eukprot:360870-Chlamydomonas_euryale.AAC.14
MPLRSASAAASSCWDRKRGRCQTEPALRAGQRQRSRALHCREIMRITPICLYLSRCRVHSQIKHDVDMTEILVEPGLVTRSPGPPAKRASYTHSDKYPNPHKFPKLLGCHDASRKLASGRLWPHV